MTQDERYMARAIELACAPRKTSPNPRVGAVLVRDGVIIAEGRHEGAGTDHAEAVALNGVDAAGATLYVNLEPCSHHGRRPPCAPLIVESKVRRVVVAHTDPDARVAGAGVEYLREAGLEVTLGVLEDEARTTNTTYLHHRSAGRPWVTLKLAFSADGRMAAPDGSSRWITGPAAREWVHKRRAEADAVLVGAGTVLADDPSLTARDDPDGQQPLRVVVDGTGRISGNAMVFDEAAETMIVTTAGTFEAQLKWKEAGAEVVVVPDDGGGVDLHALLDLLGRRGVLEVYSEGGAGLATALLASGIPNRLEFFYAPVLLGRGGPDIGRLGIDGIAQAERFVTTSVQRFGDDVLVVMERAS